MQETFWIAPHQNATPLLRFLNLQPRFARIVRSGTIIVSIFTMLNEGVCRPPCSENWLRWEQSCYMKNTIKFQWAYPHIQHLLELTMEWTIEDRLDRPRERLNGLASNESGNMMMRKPIKTVIVWRWLAWGWRALAHFYSWWTECCGKGGRFQWILPIRYNCHQRWEALTASSKTY